MPERVSTLDREQCEYVFPDAEGGDRCNRIGRRFSSNVGNRPAGRWCVLHQGGQTPKPDPARTAAALARRAALDTVTRAVLAAMRAGALGPELKEAYNQAEREHSLSGVRR